MCLDEFVVLGAKLLELFSDVFDFGGGEVSHVEIHGERGERDRDDVEQLLVRHEEAEIEERNIDADEEFVVVEIAEVGRVQHRMHLGWVLGIEEVEIDQRSDEEVHYMEEP